MFNQKDRTRIFNSEPQITTTSSNNGCYGSCERMSNRNDSGFGSYVTDEKTPLLHQTRAKAKRFINIRIFSLGILFIGGVTIGSYLLYKQNQPSPIEFIFDLINRETWGAKMFPSGQSLNASNVEHMLIYHTADRECMNLDDCMRIVKDIQIRSFNETGEDIPFNFLIGGDGRIYEGRGWSIQCGKSPIHPNIALAVAFIGNFTMKTPSDKQLNAGLTLVYESEFMRNLMKDYDVIGIRLYTRSQTDGAALFASISKWQHWNGIVSIY